MGWCGDHNQIFLRKKRYLFSMIGPPLQVVDAYNCSAGWSLNTLKSNFKSSRSIWKKCRQKSWSQTRDLSFITSSHFDHLLSSITTNLQYHHTHQSRHDGSKQGLRRIVYLFLGNKRDYSDDMNMLMMRTMVTMKIMNAGGENYLCNIIIIKCVMCLKIIIKWCQRWWYNIVYLSLGSKRHC